MADIWKTFFPFSFSPNRGCPTLLQQCINLILTRFFLPQPPLHRSSFEKWKLSQSWKLFPESDQKSTDNRQWQRNFSVENKNRSSKHDENWNLYILKASFAAIFPVWLISEIKLLSYPSRQIIHSEAYFYLLTSCPTPRRAPRSIWQLNISSPSSLFEVMCVRPKLSIRETHMRIREENLHTLPTPSFCCRYHHQLLIENIRAHVARINPAGTWKIT